MRNALLIKYGELALRGKNRRFFEDKLIGTIRAAVKPYGNYTVKKENGRFIIEDVGNETDADRLTARIKSIPGIIGVAPCVISGDKSLEGILDVSLQYMKAFHGETGATFKIETKRGDKGYPHKSPFISSEAGRHILQNSVNLTVDVKNPDITLYIEIRNRVYLYSAEIKGIGGLPAGSSGKCMVLLSAGIDSPVAAYLMAKRGAGVEAVYFHAPPYTSDRVLQKVRDVCEKLCIYCGRIDLHVVPFTDIQHKLKEKTPPEKLTILMKRAMLRVAGNVALQNGVSILVTGDSIGQVASQTLKGIEAVSSATELPVIRPLACYDKDEIIKIAREIGTYDISIQPFEDCCSLFSAKHPETKPKKTIIESIERNIAGLFEIEETAVQNAVSYEINF